MSKPAFAGLSDRGQVREVNEDALAIRPDLGLYLVSDGMGGAARGDLASRIVAETVPRMMETAIRDAVTPDLESLILPVEDSLKQLSIHVRETANRHPEFAGMGATVVLALVRRQRVLLAHMGDSRAYALKYGVLKRLTRDHSVVQALIETGEIKAKDADSHPAKNQITQCVGMDEEPLPEVDLVQLAAGDRLLLCTDGLTSMAGDAAIEAVLRQGMSPEETCAALIAEANGAGGVDNITAVVVDV